MRGVIVKVNNSEVGRRINSIRKDMGINQEDFGKRIYDAHKSLVSKWEKGQSLPNNERLKKIAEIGGITVNELLYGDFESYCYGIFDTVNADKELHYNSFDFLTDPDKKRAFYAKVFGYVKEYRYDYENFDGIYNLYNKSVAKEVEGSDFTNEGSFNYIINELGMLKHKLRNYYHTAAILNDLSNVKPGERTTIYWGDAVREGADLELYKKQRQFLDMAALEVSKMKEEYEKNNQ